MMFVPMHPLFLIISLFIIQPCKSILHCVHKAYISADPTDVIDEALEVLPVCGHDVPNTKANHFIYVGDFLLINPASQRLLVSRGRDPIYSLPTLVRHECNQGFTNTMTDKRLRIAFIHPDLGIGNILFHLIWYRVVHGRVW